MARSVASVSAGLAWLALLAAVASATQFRVGGSRGWSVPDANAEPYNSWAGRMRFQIGDQLLFVYPKETDAVVVVVDKGAYDACNTSSSVAGGGRFDDGSTVFTFDRSGPFFFISGNEASCRAGEKLIVVVMADHGGGGHTPPPMASPPSPAPVVAPSPSTSPAPSVSPMAPGSTPAATPDSAPSPAALAPAPTTTPGSPPAPAAVAPSPSSTTPGGGVSQPPPASGSPPSGAKGANTTTPAANDRSGAAAPAVAGVVVTTLGAYIGYTLLVTI